MTTFIACATVLLFMLIGFRKGFGASALDLLALIISAIAVLLLGRPLGTLLLERGQISSVTAFVLAPLGLVVVIALGFQILGLLMKRSFRGPDGKPRLRRAGALINGVTGIIYAVVFVWAIMLYRGLSGAPADEGVLVEKIAGRAVGWLGSSMVRVVYPDEPLAPRALDTVLSHPAQGLKSVQALASSPELAQLMQDPSFQAVLDGGDTAKVVADTHFQGFLANEDLRGPLTDLGIGGEGMSSQESAALQEHLAKNMIFVRKRLHALEGNPEARAILQKPELQQLLQEKDMVKLMRSPDMLRIVELVMQTGEGP